MTMKICSVADCGRFGHHSCNGKRLCIKHWLEIPYTEKDKWYNPKYEEIVNMRKAGASYFSIAMKFGIGEGRAWQICKKGVV